MMASWRRAPDMTQTQRSGWIVAALALTIGLGALRAMDFMTTPPEPAIGLTPHETRLVGLVETKTGPGSVRIHETRSGEGYRQLFVLIDTSSGVPGASDTELQDLLEAAGALNPLRGDQMEIHRTAFAAGALSQPNAMEAAELAAYLLLAACLLAQLVAISRAPAQLPAQSKLASEPISRPLTSRPKPSVGTEVDPDAPTDRRIAAVRHAMSKDPSEAARIIRAWVKDELERP